MQKTTAAAALVVALTMTGCADNEGSAESLGEEIDEAIGEAGDRVENAVDELREAGEEIDEAVRDD